MPKRKILIMDDEDMVRGVAGKMLEFLGYEAVPARDGEEAIALYASHGASGRPIDAVILDWLMPDGMDGFKVMERLRSLDPNAKGLLSSGYPDQDAEARAAAGFAGVIGKPYEIKTLKRTLDGILGIAPAEA